MQKYILVADFKLAYFDKNEEKENIIFFIHGNSLSASMWRRQINSPKLKDYRLIALDVPGHGQSAASENPEVDYSLLGMTKILAEAIKLLSGNKPYLFAGLSLGTNIIAEMLSFNTKPLGLALAGSCIIGSNYSAENFIKTNTSVFVLFTEKATEAEVKQYTSQVLFSNDASDVEDVEMSYFTVKPLVRYYLSQSIQQQHYNDEIALLKSLNIPILLIFGKDDQILNPDYLDQAPLDIWNKEIYKIPNASHMVNLDQPETFNNLLATYAKEVFKATVI